MKDAVPTNADILHLFLHRLWIEADMAAVDEIFAPEAGATGMLPDMTLTPEDFKVLAEAVLNLVHQPKFTVVKTLSDDDWVTVMIRISAASRIGGAPIAATGQILARFDGGQIVEVYNHFDFLGFFQQLGLIPQDAVSLCLSGETLS